MAAFDASVSSSGHYIPTKAAVAVRPFLGYFQTIAKKCEEDLALSGAWGNERGDVAFDCRFARGLAKIRITVTRHPLTVELQLDLVIAQSQNAEFVITAAIDSSHLGRGYGPFSRTRPAWPYDRWLLSDGRTAERAERKS